MRPRFTGAPTRCLKGQRDTRNRWATTSAATYVTLRTLNAVLSTVQEAAFTGSVVVAEATVQPLKALEPIDDTVERISDVVFAIMLAAGVLSVAMGRSARLGRLWSGWPA